MDFLPCFKNEATPKKRWQLCFQRDWRNILPCELVNYPYSTFSSYWGLSVWLKWRFSNERKTFFKKFVTLIWWNFFNSGRCALLLLFFFSSMTKTVTFIFTCNPPCLLDEKNYAIQVVKSAQTTINLVQSSKVVQVGKFILLANTRNLRSLIMTSYYTLLPPIIVENCQTECK